MSRSVFPPGCMDGIAGNLLPGDPLISYRSTKYKSMKYKIKIGKSKKQIQSLRTKNPSRKNQVERLKIKGLQSGAHLYLQQCNLDSLGKYMHKVLLLQWKCLSLASICWLYLYNAKPLGAVFLFFGTRCKVKIWINFEVRLHLIIASICLGCVFNISQWMGFSVLLKQISISY